MTMRISEDTIILVVIVVGGFVSALVCLACSLSGREVLDCSIFRCCTRRRRRHNEDEDQPQTYATLNEFIFESETEERAGFVAMNDMPTTMEQVFPDLLGGGEEDNNHTNGNHPRNNNGNPANASNAELREPLL
jgi:hypothetical protein